MPFQSISNDILSFSSFYVTTVLYTKMYSNLNNYP